MNIYRHLTILVSLICGLNVRAEDIKSLEHHRGSKESMLENAELLKPFLTVNNLVDRKGEDSSSRTNQTLKDLVSQAMIENDPKLGGLLLRTPTPQHQIDVGEGSPPLLAQVVERKQSSPPINFRYQPPQNMNYLSKTRGKISTTPSTSVNNNRLKTTAIPVSSQKSQEIRMYETIFKVFSYLFLGIIIFSNLMVLTAYSKYERLRTITNRFVISLAVADLCVGLSRSIQEIVEYIDPSDPSQKIVTYRGQFFATFPTTMNAASLLCLLGVTVDRYIAVINPLRYSAVMTEKLANCIIVGAWCLAAVIIYLVPHFFVFFWNNQTITQYYFLYRYILITYFILFVSLLFIISLFYARIFYACNKHQLMALFSKDFSQRVSSSQLPTPVQSRGTTSNFGHGKQLMGDDTSLASSTYPPKTGAGLQNGGAPVATGTEDKQLIPGGTGDSLTVPKKTSFAESISSEPVKNNSPVTPQSILKTANSSLHGGSPSSIPKGHKDSTGNRDHVTSRTVSISEDRGEDSPFLGPQKSTSKEDGLRRHSGETTPLSRRESAGVIIASKATIMIAMIVGTFATLGLPLQIMEYVLIFKHDSIRNQTLFFICHGICVQLYYLNSAVNPYIYSWKNRDFREAFKRILTCNRRLKIFHKDRQSSSYFSDLPPPSTRKSRLTSMFSSSFDKTKEDDSNGSHPKRHWWSRFISSRDPRSTSDKGRPINERKAPDVALDVMGNGDVTTKDGGDLWKPRNSVSGSQPAAAAIVATSAC